MEQIVFFGDSLSDTGNYPEPFDVKNPSYKNFNLYVPITNPVISCGGQNTSLCVFLNKSISSPGKINGQYKHMYSINWPLYFTYFAGKSSLISWYQFVINDMKEGDAINYAWASAVTGASNGSDPKFGQCFHDNGDVIGNCSVNSILQARGAYFNHTKQDDEFDKNTKYMYNDVVIPDLIRQVAFYSNNVQGKGLNDTTFFIYIGGNDIGNFLKSKILEIGITTPEYFMNEYIKPQVTVIVDHVANAVKNIENMYFNTTSIYQIYVMTVPHFSNLHEGYAYGHIPLEGSKITKALNTMVDLYNEALNTSLSSKAEIIQIGAFIDTLANNSEYNNSVIYGLMCIEDPSGEYLNPTITTNDNCCYDVGTYLGWNNAHFVSTINEQIASYIWHIINNVEEQI